MDLFKPLQVRNDFKTSTRQPTGGDKKATRLKDADDFIEKAWFILNMKHRIFAETHIKSFIIERQGTGCHQFKVNFVVNVGFFNVEGRFLNQLWFYIDANYLVGVMVTN